MILPLKVMILPFENDDSSFEMLFCYVTVTRLQHHSSIILHCVLITVIVSVLLGETVLVNPHC